MVTTPTQCQPLDYMRALGSAALRAFRSCDHEIVSNAPFANLDARRSMIAFSAVTVLVGVVSGLAGMSLALLLHVMQHAAFGLGSDSGSFLSDITNASALRRFVVVCGCGLVAGAGGIGLYRWAKPNVNASKTAGHNAAGMPFGSTLLEALLQITTAALGSPLGNEAAPRAVGALFAERLSQLSGMTARDTQVMVACGAGAGLAAVYNVPVAAAIFIAEGLLRSARPTILVPAIVACAIAAVVARTGLGNGHLYSMTVHPVGISLMAAAIVSGPLFGLAGFFFRTLMHRAQTGSSSEFRLIASSLLTFCVVGLFSLEFPQLLGNGKDSAQMAFSASVDPRLAIDIIALKVLAIALVLKGGARGGLLTPSFATGALLATVVGSAWNLYLPEIPLAAFAVVGAATFLGSSMAMPITAIALAMEFLHLPTSYLFPLVIAATGAMATRLLLQVCPIEPGALQPAS